MGLSSFSPIFLLNQDVHMNTYLLYISMLVGFLCLSSVSMAQVPDSTEVEDDWWDDDEDFSMYEDLDFEDQAAKRFASAKILDISPQRFISFHWDAQMRYRAQFSPIGEFQDEGTRPVAEEGIANYTGGMRLIANIPVISKNSVIWQMGANFWDTRYSFSDINQSENSAGLINILNEDGIRTSGINTTVFKPLNDESFLLFQGSADLSGNYSFAHFQSLRYLRYSAAVLWGKRPSDRKQWAVGIARTYRVGELNYLPIIMYNYTAPSRKWGIEMLLPARAHYRRTFNSRNLLLAGYELEGQSYRIRQLSTDDKSFEIRRGELRFRLEYMRQLSGFIWWSVQGGLRYNYINHADFITNNGNDFFRGFFGDQPYAMLSTLGHPLYFNIGIHLLSP